MERKPLDLPTRIATSIIAGGTLGAAFSERGEFWLVAGICAWLVYGVLTGFCHLVAERCPDPERHRPLDAQPSARSRPMYADVEDAMNKWRSCRVCNVITQDLIAHIRTEAHRRAEPRFALSLADQGICPYCDGASLATCNVPRHAQEIARIRHDIRGGNSTSQQDGSA